MCIFIKDTKTGLCIAATHTSGNIEGKKRLKNISVFHFKSPSEVARLRYSALQTTQNNSVLFA